MAGANALTPAEHKTVDRLIQSGWGQWIWDTDRSYVREGLEAGRFVREIVSKERQADLPQPMAEVTGAGKDKVRDWNMVTCSSRTMQTQYSAGNTWSPSTKKTSIASLSSCLLQTSRPWSWPPFHRALKGQPHHGRSLGPHPTPQLSSPAVRSAWRQWPPAPQQVARSLGAPPYQSPPTSGRRATWPPSRDAAPNNPHSVDPPRPGGLPGSRSTPWPLVGGGSMLQPPKKTTAPQQCCLKSHDGPQAAPKAFPKTLG